MFFEEVLEVLPNIKVILLEPFVLEGVCTENAEEFPDRWEKFSQEVPEKAMVVKRVADKFGFPFIPLQDRFDEAVKLTGDTAYWLRDGVHPTEKGHELIKREWLKAFEQL